MNLIEVKDTKYLDTLVDMHIAAYREKFESHQISLERKDYITSTLGDIHLRRVFLTLDMSALIVCEDRTDLLIKNSTYHLITRIYVKPNFRHKGVAKLMVRECQKHLGTLMGYSGKFYILGDQK